MRLLVTGGAGFIGSHYVRKLLTDPWGLEQPERLVVLDKLTYAGNLANLRPVADDPRLVFVRGNVTDTELVERLLAEVDHVVHFAAESHVDRSIEGGRDFVVTNVLGTQTLLEASRRHPVHRFVHVSTDEVYGSLTSGSCDEETSLVPSSPYAASKASSDLIALAHHRTYGSPVCITRCSNNYGPYQYPEKLIPLAITNLFDGSPVPLYGDGLHVRDWIHVDDHCRAVHMILKSGRVGEVYNVGGGTELANLELTELILAALGRSRKDLAWVDDRLGHDRRYALDTTKLSSELGFFPAVSFESGIAETIDWYRARRDWWEPLKARDPLI